MALIACRECGKPASSKATKCPHCGIENPDKGTARTQGCAQGCGTVAMLPWIIAAVALFLAYLAEYIG